MKNFDIQVEAVFDETGLSLEELCRCFALAPGWVEERVQAGLLSEVSGAPGTWRFDAVTLRRVRVMAQIERDFDAVPELAALVADLQEEVARLRRRVR
ncbi:MAG: MerR family transcriptional regulator [Burkholderiales bacterium]|nr:MerR family transcriptional regulator [Burkholderiales bacterium]MDE2397232.1 MerR family transcriptional regulator [Burkholderiales bacterium]MDE2457547.1 MerR family transcriptional regulator [Burkholderiales bacterium]